MTRTHPPFISDQTLSDFPLAPRSIDPTSFWVNPFGRSWNQMRVRDLLRISAEGEIVEGGTPQGQIYNQAAFSTYRRFAPVPERSADASSSIDSDSVSLPSVLDFTAEKLTLQSPQPRHPHRTTRRHRSSRSASVA